MITIRHAPEVPEGDGVTVRRLMPVHGLLNADPFVLWDHFVIDNGAGFPDHPHRGFEAITYIFSGGMRHADNLGNASTVTAGGAQRFTAGRGLVHSEIPIPEGTTAGIQLWINLPKRLKAIVPEYQQVDAADFPEQAIEGGTIRTLVGEGSPLQLHTDVLYLELRLEKGAAWTQAIPEGMRGFVYVVEGAVEIDGHAIQAGNAALVNECTAIAISALEASQTMLCFGRPHHEPIRQHGPFVDNIRKKRETTMTKKAQTAIDIHDIIAHRWSARAFDASRPLQRETIISLLEAARWAPSCFGDEPWRFIVCNRSENPEAWQKAFDCLAPKNQLWSGNAPLLLLACADSAFRANDKPNRWGQYDTGAASENLCLQAIELGLIAHQMGGFDIDRARATFRIPERFTPMAMIAVGYQAEADILDEEFKAIELAERKRRPLGELFFAGEWGKELA